MPLIYKFTNTLNGKAYIGYTSKTLEERWRQHTKPRSTNFHFHNALNKYGSEFFTKEVLEEGDYVTALEHEVKWITYYDTFYNGYNLTAGGEGVSGYKHTEETKKLLSEKSKGNTSHLGFKHSEETKAKMGLANVGNSYCTGRVVSEETKKLLSKAMTGRVSPRKGTTHKEDSIRKMRISSARYSYNINGVDYELVSDVMEDYNCADYTVANRCKSDNFPEWFRTKLNKVK